ncbi:MAG: hypothetical protein ACRC06_14230 [Waterburya sp.]
MNSANSSVFILFSSVVYLLGIYGLLKIAEMQKSGGTIVTNNHKNTSDQIKTP